MVSVDRERELLTYFVVPTAPTSLGLRRPVK